MRRDAAMIRACGTFLGGFDDSLDLSAEELAEVTVPVHVLVGTDDPVGGAEVAERLAEMLPQSSVEVWTASVTFPGWTTRAGSRKACRRC